MPPWVERPILTLDLHRIRRGAPPELPREAVESCRALLNEVMITVPKKARFLAYLLALRTGNRFGREFKTAAKLIDADPRDIALANLSYDLVVGALGCSTIVLPTQEGPVVARNMDWWPEGPLARASYVVRCLKGDEWVFSSAGFPGAVGIVTGLSARGFAVILNAVTTPEPFHKTGYPVLLHLRRVIEDAANFSDALAMLAKQKLTTSALFTLVGAKNDECIVIERSPKRHALRRASLHEPLITTNNYRLLDMVPSTGDHWDLSRSSCGRYDRLWQLAHGRTEVEPPTTEELLYWLADEQVRQEITAQHVIIRPALGDMRLFVPRHLV